MSLKLADTHYIKQEKDVCNNHSGLVPSTFLAFHDVFKGSREQGYKKQEPFHRYRESNSTGIFKCVSAEQDTRKRVSVVDMLLDKPHPAFVLCTRFIVSTDKFMVATVSCQTLDSVPWNAWSTVALQHACSMKSAHQQRLSEDGWDSRDEGCTMVV